MPRSRSAPLALALAAALAACVGGEPPPRWIDLTRGHRPRPLEELAARLEARVQPPRAGRLVREDEEVWFELPLPRSSWTATDVPGVWTTPLPAGGALLASERSTLAVLEGEQALRQGVPRKERAGRFWIDGSTLKITVPSESEPSDAFRFRVRLDHGREVGGAWRVAQWDLACDGLLVFPDVPEALAAEIPPGSALRFATVAPDPEGRGAELAPTTFRVKLDGRTLFEHTQSYARPLRAAWHEVALDARGAHELAFEVSGDAPAVFGTPALVPVERGAPGARPWPEPRKDVVLVLCDTFRADNLSAWGGEGLAPHLDRLVERSLRFLDARSAAAWTLPSIATILSGVFPAQHGGTDLDRGVRDGVETIAETLHAQGWRTVALTDSGLFSRHYHQDQGFEWFEEALLADWNLNHTLARARQQMGADDGRPLFLVVHTYRVHGPMRLGPEEDIAPHNELRARIRARMQELEQSEGEVAKRTVALEFLDEGRAFYADAVRDLDAKVGSWIEELERAGFLERGRLVLTADHGNSHGEHGQIGHGSDLYDVKLRVPLAIAGAGIEPRAVAGPVSLIDLAPTMADLAGATPSPSWIGRSLLDRFPGGPIYAFDFAHRNHQLALYAEGRKLMARDVQALREGKPSHAFDLGADPAEDENLAERTSWPGELGRALADRLEPLLVPASEASALELPPEIAEQLKAIGYGE